MNITKFHFPKNFNIKLGSFFSINFWTIPVILCSVRGGYFSRFAAAYAIALFHEFSHIFCARRMRVPISGICVYPFGVAARLRRGYIQSSAAEFFIAFAGPFSNAVLFWVLCALNHFYPSELLLYCMDINLAMCAVNLIPSLPLDGGRMFKSILTPRLGIIRAYNFAIKISRAAIIALIAAAAYILFVSNFNFSLVLIAAFLLQNLCSESQTLSVITVKEVLNSHAKPREREQSVRVLCADQNLPARSILRYLTYDYFYIICVTDENSEIIGQLTESQIFSALSEKGVRTLYRDIL